MGVSSIEIIRLKTKIQTALDLKVEIPIITVMTNPTIAALSVAILSLQRPKAYNPVVTLQSGGSKTPLFLVHPGVGEVLVFLNLAKYIVDRPIYALRARGFDAGEKPFDNIPEIISTYHAAIKGVFNLPPHIKFRMRQLDWISVLLHLSYFLDLMTEEHAHAISPAMHAFSNDEVLDKIIAQSPQDRLEEMALDKEKLRAWTDISHGLHVIAHDYDPSGTVNTMDVFYAIPLAAVAENKLDWMDNHLIKWKEFVRGEGEVWSQQKKGDGVRFHEVEGAHYTMLGPENVHSFQKKLRAVLKERDL
jgi:thioesterase domain-containing protein